MNFYVIITLFLVLLLVVDNMLKLEACPFVDGTEAILLRRDCSSRGWAGLTYSCHEVQTAVSAKQLTDILLSAACRLAKQGTSRQRRTFQSRLKLRLAWPRSDLRRLQSQSPTHLGSSACILDNTPLRTALIHGTSYGNVGVEKNRAIVVQLRELERGRARLVLKWSD